MEKLNLEPGRYYERKHTVAAGVVIKTICRVREELEDGYLLDLGNGSKEKISFYNPDTFVELKMN